MRVGGYWIAGCEQAPIFDVIMTFLGAAGGFIEVLVMLKRAEKRDERNESGGTGPGPS
jgi:hypothetical protein